MAPRLILHLAFAICCFFDLLRCEFFALAAGAPAGKARDRGSISREAEIIDVRDLGNKRIRVIFSAQENDGVQRFPITTIDRSMVKVDFTNTASAPADAESLMLNGSGAVALNRALFIGFSLHRNLGARALDEIRADVSDLVKELQAEQLTIAAISQDSARVIADVTPQKSDNINRILQQLQLIGSEGEGPALSDTLCVAAERFHAWDLNHFHKGDQKALIIMSNPGDPPSTERFRGQNCWRSLLDQGVRVFFVSFGETTGKASFDLADVAQDSGGYVHRVSGPVEMNAAVKNVIALLRNEYAVDVEAPSIAAEDQPLELKLRISYHDEVFESKVYNVGYVIPALTGGVSAAPKLAPGVDDVESTAQEGLYSTFLAIVSGSVGLAMLLGGAFLVRRYVTYRLRTVACTTCRSRVARDHSDCPFRKSSCVARLVFVGGAYAGQTIPIMVGETRLSRFPFKKGSISVPGAKVDWLYHGSIIIEGNKAIYTPGKGARDRVNGWLVSEPRLLGIGSVLKICEQNLRFEIKTQIMAG